MMPCAKKPRALLATVLLSFALSGCQNLVEPAPSADLLERQALEVLVNRHEALIKSRDEFKVTGGLGIWTNDESISARINWQQSPQSLHLTLTGPLGIGTLQLMDVDDRATLTRGEQLLASGSSADQVLQQGLGLQAPIPLEELTAWIRGLPSNANLVKRDGEGKLLTLQFMDEQGTSWQVRFKRYTNWEGVHVPSLITASGGPYSVRIALKEWQNAMASVVPDTPESNKRLPIPGR